MSTHTEEPTPSGNSLVGTIVSGRYRIERMLGEGGMGAVYLAEHTHMRKRVALKLLHAEMSGEQEILARFRREAEAAARVEHPNVAAATDFGQTEDGSFFLVLEYVEGTSLRDAMRSGALGASRSLHIARQVALALERAHGSGIVHRDLKPENVMLVRKGDDPDFVKVLDFGIAKLEPHPTHDSAQPLTRMGTILGTPEYMAPEQALGDTVGPGADLYALGVIVYEMLTGKHPFDADDRMAVLSMHIVAPVPPMGDKNPSVTIPPPIEALVRRLLEKEAAARPSGARALIDLIDSTAHESGVELPHASPRSHVGGDFQRDSGAVPPSELAQRTSRAGHWQAEASLAKTDYQLPSQRDLAAPTQASRGLVDRLLTEVPRGVLIGIAAIVPLVVVGVVFTIVLAMRSSSTASQTDGGAADHGSGTPALFRSKTASAEKLAAANAGGVAALEALAGSYPEDPAVLNAYARALGTAGRLPDMLRVVRSLTALEKATVDDAVLDSVALAAQREATADDAFALLEGPLGARGVDTLLELGSMKTAPAVTQRRAAKSIARAEVRANASPAAAVLLELRAAKTCADRHDLLPRITESGDGRVLATLKTMKSPRGCGFLGSRDCWPCLRKDDALETAIKAVESRPAP